jgi:ABC-2 type transport system ATP-binding protein
LSALRAYDRGSVRVLGYDPRADRYALRKHIGVQLQEAALQDRLKVWEALDLYASFYPRALDQRALLEQAGLSEKRTTRFARLSGGQKQRLFIALALLHDPQVVFLDELTTGLDPQARRVMWEMVRQVRARGKTIVLITHSMEEAERLCDRVAIVDHGRMVALDTPEHLVNGLGGESQIVFTVEGQPDLEPLRSLAQVCQVQQKADCVIVSGRLNGDLLLSSVVQALPAYILGVLSMYAAGFLLASLLPGARVAAAVSMVLFLAMLYLCGVLLPLSLFPPALREAVQFLPPTHVVVLLQDLWMGANWSSHWGDVLALLGILLVCVCLAARLFRWR